MYEYKSEKNEKERVRLVMKMTIVALTAVLTLSVLSLGVGAATVNDAAEELEGEDPIEIYDWHDLDAVRDNLTADYVLMNDLDEDTDGYDELVDTEDGWDPIGDFDDDFIGSFDGQNHTISDLYIDRTSTSYIGLFGYIDGSTIENIGLEDVDVSGDNRVGGLVGTNRDSTTVSNSYSTGNVSGNDYVGGLVGQNRDSAVSNSYSTGNVSGDNQVGGLVGQSSDSSTVSNSYSTGNVSGDNQVGSLVGRVWNFDGDTDEILYSYANSDINPDLDLIGNTSDVSGTLNTTGSSLKTTAEMTDYPDYPECYEGWAFTETWQKTDWNTDQEGNSGYPALDWEEPPEKYDLTINIEGEGTTDPEEGTHTFYEGENVTIEATPDDGWEFDEWTGDETGTDPTIDITMDENKSITAVFEEEPPEKYDLTINIEGEGTTDPEEGTHTFYEGENVTIEATPDDGWEFVEWTGDVTGTETTIDITMDSDKSITAVFEIVEYDLTINIEGEGSTEPEEGTHTYEEGEEVTITATPDEHWYFVEWTGDYSGTEEEITVTMDEDKSLTAWFEQHEYTLEVSIEGEGTVDIEPDKEEYEPGTEVNLTAIADDHWYFVEWSGDYEGTDENITVEMTDDMNITATFEVETYTLDVDIEGQGTVEVDPEKDEYEYGTSVSLSAEPDAGWYFVEWTGTRYDYLENISVLMTEDFEQTAHFAENRVDVDVEGDGQVFVEVYENDTWKEHRNSPIESAGHFYGDENTEYRLTADSEKHWYFGNWTGDYESEQEEIEFNITDDMQIDVTFIEGATLNIDVEGHGDVLTPGVGEFVFEPGTEVVLEVDELGDYQFDGWTGDTENIENIYSTHTYIELEEDVNITAEFDTEDDDTVPPPSNGDEDDSGMLSLITENWIPIVIILIVILGIGALAIMDDQA